MNNIDHPTQMSTRFELLSHIDELPAESLPSCDNYCKAVFNASIEELKSLGVRNPHGKKLPEKRNFTYQAPAKKQKTELQLYRVLNGAGLNLDTLDPQISWPQKNVFLALLNSNLYACNINTDAVNLAYTCQQNEQIKGVVYDSFRHYALLYKSDHDIVEIDLAADSKRINLNIPATHLRPISANEYLVGSHDGNIHLVDHRSRDTICPDRVLVSPISRVASNNEYYFAAGSFESPVVIWDKRRFVKPLTNLPQHNKFTLGLQFAPTNPNAILTSCGDGWIRVYNVGLGTLSSQYYTDHEISNLHMTDQNELVSVNHVCLGDGFFTETKKHFTIWDYQPKEYTLAERFSYIDKNVQTFQFATCHSDPQYFITNQIDQLYFWDVLKKPVKKTTLFETFPAPTIR